MVMVGSKGVTNNAKQAKYLVVVKKYSDTAYERLDYNFTGPIIKLTTYKDSLLKVLNGRSATFDKSGGISQDGNYQDNKKEGSWFLYDDTAHATFEYKYYSNSLIVKIDLDSLAEENKKIRNDTTDQREAAYKGGDANFTKLVQQNMKVPDRTAEVSNGGTTRVRFIVDTFGHPIHIELIKSVEFALDEESLRVISLGREWIPASDKGRKLNAFRIQPFSIKIQ